MVAGALLTAALAALWLYLHSSRWWPRNRAVAEDRYRRGVVLQLLLLGAVPLTALLLLGRLAALTSLPGEFAGARRLAVALVGEMPLGEVAAAGSAGLLIGTLVAAWRVRHGRRRWQIGDVEALLPASPRELGWAALLSICAGTAEELFFRLLLPLLITLVSGNALLGFGGALALFGASHRYQRWPGVLAILALGLLLTVAYLTTASLLLAMLLHTMVDLNALVLRPVLERRIRWRG